MVLQERAICGVDASCLQPEVGDDSEKIFPPLDAVERIFLQYMHDTHVKNQKARIRKPAKNKVPEVVCQPPGELIATEQSSEDCAPPLLLGVLALRLLRVALDSSSQSASPCAAAVLEGLCSGGDSLSPALETLSSGLNATLLALEQHQRSQDMPHKQGRDSHHLRKQQIEQQGREVKDALLQKCRRAVSCLSCNLFTVTDAELLPLGVALFPTGALFNHSCDPSAAQVFPLCQQRRMGEGGTTGGKENRAADSRATRRSSSVCMYRVLEVRITQKVLPGQEVCVSYVDTGAPLEARSRALKKHYNFQCCCFR